MTGYFEHVTRPGERWDLIAHRYYGNVRRQRELIAANRALFVDPIRPIPAVLPGGLVLRVPVVAEAPDESNLPPWKRGQPTAPTRAIGGAS